MHENQWIPAFAGMTEEGVPGCAVRTFIPAFAGMTGGTPAVDVSGAEACDMGDHPWIPAFAGMTAMAFTGVTAIDDQRARIAPKFPARQRGQVP